MFNTKGKKKYFGKKIFLKLCLSVNGFASTWYKIVSRERNELNEDLLI